MLDFSKLTAQSMNESKYIVPYWKGQSIPPDGIPRSFNKPVVAYMIVTFNTAVFF